jgi:hypothetical protein
MRLCYSVSILFDGEDQPLIYHEVLARSELDTIISDAIPCSKDITPGSKIAFKISDPERNWFMEATVLDVCASPPQFLIRPLDDLVQGQGHGVPEQRWVKRAHLRAIVPPWWEEIMHPNFAVSRHAPISSFVDLDESDDDLKKEDISFVGESGPLTPGRSVSLTPGES